MSDEYKATEGMFVCAPTDYTKDLAALEDIVKRYKSIGGKLPSQLELALEAAKAGRNVEESMNVACDGLFRFYIAEETRCAKKAGFDSLDQLKREGGTRLQERDEFDVCVASVARQYQVKAVDYAINPFNSQSALSQYLVKTWGQVKAITSKYIKKKVLNDIKAGGATVKLNSIPKSK